MHVRDGNGRVGARKPASRAIIQGHVCPAAAVNVAPGRAARSSWRRNGRRPPRAPGGGGRPGSWLLRIFLGRSLLPAGGRGY